MKGKDTCKILKEIRRQIAEHNDIAYVTEECQFKGECKGTCPKCEAEVRQLSEELSKRRRLGKKVALVGIAAGLMTASMTACTPEVMDIVKQIVGVEPESLSGDVPYPMMGEATIYPSPYDTGIVNPDFPLPEGTTEPER